MQKVPPDYAGSDLWEGTAAAEGYIGQYATDVFTNKSVQIVDNHDFAKVPLMNFYAKRAVRLDFRTNACFAATVPLCFSPGTSSLESLRARASPIEADCTFSAYLSRWSTTICWYSDTVCGVVRSTLAVFYEQVQWVLWMIQSEI